jgi:hypothetical protein
MGVRYDFMKYIYAVVLNGKLQKFDSSDKAVMLSRIEAFYRENNFSFDRQSISNSIDRQSKLLSKPKKLTLGQAATGAMALIKSIAGSSVSNEELMRRSAICEGCPLISLIGGCSSCGAAGKISNWANSIRSSKGLQVAIPSTVSQSYCGVCSCALALMVVTKRADFHDESDKENSRRPDVCWLNRSSTNYTNE